MSSVLPLPPRPPAWAWAWAWALGLGACASPPIGPAALTEPAPIRAGRAPAAGTYGHLDVVHYDVVVGLPASGGRVVEGAATLRVRPARDGLSEAVLDFTGLTVLGVAVDGTAVQAAHRDGRRTGTGGSRSRCRRGRGRRTPSP